MVDRVKIYVQAGAGGSGCNSFKGKKFTRSRHPDGGCAGRGADVIIRVDKDIRSLEHLQFKQFFKAENGKGGQANKKKGADSRPCIIRVPAGTIVRDLKGNLLLRDLIKPDEQLLVAKAGAGGRGNSRTEAATAGLPGEQRHLALELKLVADVAIVGEPNAGKSTLLARITSARPKIAAYPFTTAAPCLGVVEFSDFEQPSTLTMVEIPALVKGSHTGKGLGASFLRHAERAGILIHLIDMAAAEGCDPGESYHNLNQELEFHSSQLAKKPRILAANKMDLPAAKANFSKFSSQMKKKIYPICALDGSGVKELLDNLRSYFMV